MKFLFALLIALFLVVGCQPATVVVTATPIPATATPVVLIVTATPAPPTATPDNPTPTREVATFTPTPRPIATVRALDAHAECVQENAGKWDEICIVNENYDLGGVPSFRTISGVVVSVPKSYTLYTESAPLPSRCDSFICTFSVQWAAPQATTGYEQALPDVFRNQCYAIKSVWTYKVRKENNRFDSGLLFVGYRAQRGNADDSGWVWQDFPAPDGTADKDGWLWGTFESLMPYKSSKADPTLYYTVALKSQWGVFGGDSVVTLYDIFVLAAPASYCAGGFIAY